MKFSLLALLNLFLLSAKCYIDICCKLPAVNKNCELKGKEKKNILHLFFTKLAPRLI